MRDHAHAAKLATRIEIAETLLEAGAYEEHLRRHPDENGEVQSRGHAHVIHSGLPDRITRLWGFALAEPEVDLLDEAIVEARRRAQHKVTFEWNPYMSDELFEILAERRFVVQEFTNTYRLVEPSSPSRPLDAGLRVALLDVTDRAMVEAAASAWVSALKPADQTPAFMAVACMMLSSTRRLTFMALEGDEVAGIGTIALHDGLGFLSVAGTRPEHRGRGIQSHLLHARITHAQENGCDLITIGSDPGTISQRNIERRGFSCLYTKLTAKLVLDA